MIFINASENAAELPHGHISSLFVIIIRSPPPTGVSIFQLFILASSSFVTINRYHIKLSATMDLGTIFIFVLEKRTNNTESGPVR